MKRKRDERQQSDPKLQEFLRVMKPGREDEDIGRSVIEGASLGPPNAGANLIEEGSDDEYEKIPAHKEKQRKMEPSEICRPLDPAIATQVEAAAEAPAAVTGQSRPPDDGSQDVSEKQNGGSVNVETTDDDWLRSRTNRLLDLVEPEDLPQAATLNPVTTRDEMTPRGEAKVMGGESTSAQALDILQVMDKGQLDTEAEASDNPIDAIRQTSRLFIRNLSYQVGEDEVKLEFERFGEMLEVRKFFLMRTHSPPE